MPAIIDFTWVRPLEPPIVAMSSREGLAIAECADGYVVICIGPDDAPCETLIIPEEYIACIGRTLMSIAERLG